MNLGLEVERKPVVVIKPIHILVAQTITLVGTKRLTTRDKYTFKLSTG